MDEYMTASEVAQQLRVSKPAVYKWVAEGKLEAARFGRAVRILRSSVEALESSARTGTAEKNEMPGVVLAV